MAKALKMQPAQAPTATIPTPLGPDDLMVPKGMMLVNQEAYERLTEVAQQLIQQKKDLRAKNDEYKGDITTMVNCFAQLAPLVGNGGFNPSSIMALMKNKDKLMAAIGPMAQVVDKYTAPAPVPQLAE
ncbi:MAG: hypothetical protein ACRYFZ_00910 [Janthinobacterium lividum]